MRCHYCSHESPVTFTTCPNCGRYGNPSDRVDHLGIATTILFVAVGWGYLLMMFGGPPVVTLVTGLGNLGLLIVFLTWFHRVSRNAGRWAAQRYGSGWAIGGWFVPIGLLWIPVRVAAGAWRASARPSRLPWSLGIWWACWILTWITSFRVIHTTTTTSFSTTTTVDRFQAGPGMTTLSAAFAVFAAAAAAVFVWRLSRAQTTRAAERPV